MPDDYLLANPPSMAAMLAAIVESSEDAVIGKSLEGISTPYVLSTKLGGRPQPFQPQDKDCLMQSVEQSLKLLKRDVKMVLFPSGGHDVSRTGKPSLRVERLQHGTRQRRKR